MSEKSVNCPLIYLKPGELVISAKPLIITTVLGSCISVIMYAEKIKLGGMCHAMLPVYPSLENKVYRNKENYVDTAIMAMLEKFSHAGITPAHIQVKVFGGGDVLEASQHKSDPFSVGRKNIDTALMILKREGLNIACHDVGGNRGRKLFFYNQSGAVVMRFVAAINHPSASKLIRQQRLLIQKMMLDAHV
jgi:chemotaxis protein CheD